MFTARQRFEAGYDMAARVVDRGLACKEANFGFSPRKYVVLAAEDVLAVHHDQVFAAGWMAGYAEATGGGTCLSGDAAFAAAVLAGLDVPGDNH